MVVDTSALLAVFFDEPEGKWVTDRLAEHATELRMSTVNLAETLIGSEIASPSSTTRLKRSC
ncbi:MAG TPA: type II toxin-antitoxin system VapC family toxin [Thermoanaerobaculia bacterium]|jgi:uncharacterized protein with PIN domain|nr:type II toxin-antitoxin system VapC family toxin [Thermoanaerobaculia bacterium]